MLQQQGLADAGLAAHHEGVRRAGGDLSHDDVGESLFDLAPDHRGGSSPSWFRTARTPPQSGPPAACSDRSRRTIRDNPYAVPL